MLDRRAAAAVGKEGFRWAKWLWRISRGRASDLVGVPRVGHGHRLLGLVGGVEAGDGAEGLLGLPGQGAGQAPDGEWMARLKLVLAAPAIRGEYLKVTSEMQEALAEAIAARTGTDIGQDMYPRILAGAVIAAAQVAVRRWSAADPPVPLGPLLRRALEQLATACSQD